MFPEIREPYKFYEHPGVDCGDESHVKQSFKDECDINRIVSHFQATGIMPQGNGPGMYGDVSGLTDYRSAIEQVRLAEGMFMKLPSKIRAHFLNDPAELLDAFGDPDRVDELKELGLVPPGIPDDVKEIQEGEAKPEKEPEAT